MIKFIFLFLILVSFQDNQQLEGRWKMYEAEAFLNILSSRNFMLGTEVQQKEIAETFQFAIDNTYYSFKGDSIFFTDTGAHNTLNHKSGKWLVRSDTLIIFESKKIKTHKYLIESLVDNKLIMKIIFPNGEVSLSNMKFMKVE